jgi:hypothetical protein
MSFERADAKTVFTDERGLWIFARSQKGHNKSVEKSPLYNRTIDVGPEIDFTHAHSHLKRRSDASL